MVLESPTKAERKRFEELQRQGLLPSESLKKIETERRLGIIPEEEKSKFPIHITKENWWFYAALGALGIGTLYIYLKSPKPSTPPTQTASLNIENTNNTNNVEYVEYIDLYPIEFEEDY